MHNPAVCRRCDALNSRSDAVESEVPAGSRRFLTLLFADLCESSQLATLVDAEEFAQVLRRLREAARRVIAQHRGTIARIQGDGVVAIFGHPQAEEDDARRAVEAALDLREAIDALHVAGMHRTAARIGLHSGIHAGLVFIEEGDIERGRFDLAGHTVNTAARLCSLAQDAEICISESALGAFRDFFVTQGVRNVVVKGQPEPVPVRTITGRSAAARRFEASARRGLAGFVGRDAAWQQLAAAWKAVEHGRPAAVLVTGQPGLGKTRLIEEFARGALVHRATVLRGYCVAYFGAEPLQPFLQLLRGAAPAQGSLPSTPAGIAGWLASLAARGPLVLILDDWQWADDASRQTLDRVLNLTAPVMALVASRSAAAAALKEHQHEVVELAPLDAEQTRQMVQHWLPVRDPFLADEIHVYGGGIPLFVEELCHAHAAGGSLQAGVPQSGTAWLSTLVASRVTRLDADLAGLLRLASVLGRLFPAKLLAAAAPCSEDDPRIAALGEQDFLFPADPPGMLRFKHGITRDAVYATVRLSERQRLHARIAQLLQTQSDGSDAPFEALAYHTSAAGDPGRAALYAQAAGDKAMAGNSLDRAREQYTAALHNLDHLPGFADEDLRRWCQVAQKLGMACVFDPISIPDRERLLERAVALAAQLHDDNALARAHYWLGYARYAVGRAKRGLPNCERALALATASGDTRLAAQVRATLGQSLTAVCRYDEALPLLDEAIGSKRRSAAPGGSTAIGSAYALACQGLLLADRGDFRPSRDCFAESRTLLAGSAHPVAASVCGLAGISLLWEGAWDEAAAVADEGARVADAARSRQLLAMGRSIAGYARWVSSGDRAGVTAIREAVQWIEARGGLFMVSLLYGWLMDAAATLGDTSSVRRDAARLLMRARDGDRIGEAMGCRAMARLAATAGGRPHPAAAWLARAERAAAARQSAHELANNQLVRAFLTHAAGDAAEGDRLARAACNAFEGLGMRWHAACARTLAGVPSGIQSASSSAFSFSASARNPSGVG